MVSAIREFKEIGRKERNFDNIPDNKQTEWDQQRAGSIAHHHGHSIVDTGAYAAVSPLVRPFNL